MTQTKKILYRLLFSVFVAIVLFGISSVYNTAYASIGDTDDGVYFSEDIAVPGSSLTVNCDTEGNDEINYKWYINNKLIGISDSVYKISGSDQQKFIRAEVWNGDTKLGEAEVFCSNLPVMYINTENGAAVESKDYYINSEIHIQGNEYYNSETTKLYSGKAEIKGRGNSTWKRFPKKPYKIKLDKKTSLFGYGKNKHWVLLANYIDESLMRNMLAGDIATRMGVGAMDGTWVDVVLNGKPVGNYMLCEHIRLSEDRVNVFDWESAGEDIAEAIATKEGMSKQEQDALEEYMVEKDMSWMSTGEVKYNGKLYVTEDYSENLPDEFNGGYLLELDTSYDEVSKFTTTNGAPVMFKSPEYIYTDATAMSAVQKYIQMFEDALYSNDKCIEKDDKIISYAELCDVDSFASFWLASELLSNEIGVKSTYVQKDIDQPLIFGPVWDFDFSSGSTAPFGTQGATDWISDNGRWWVAQAMQDPYFAVKVRNVYLENEEYLKELVSDSGTLDDWYSYLYKSGEYNDKLWNYSRGFDEDFNALKSWLTKRIEWMDKQFATNASAMKSMGITFSDKFNITLQADNILASQGNGYEISNIENQSLNVDVSVNSGDYKALNYYVNSHYGGSAEIVDGHVNIIIRNDQLTESIGMDNVITIWLKDNAGNMAEQQYITVKIASEDQRYRNVVFNDLGGTYAHKVRDGAKIYLDEPLNETEDTSFAGWSDGVNTYEAGKWLKVEDDVTMTAVWNTCKDGSYSHKWTGTEDVLKCENCSATKKVEKNYIDVAICTYTQSSRYYTRYTGKEVAPVINVTYNGTTLTENVDYTITIKNNINAGFATYTVKGIKSAGYTGEVNLTYRIISRSIKSAKFVKEKAYAYGGANAVPKFTLTYNGMTLEYGTDYTVSANGKAPGVAEATITGKGNFEGSRTVSYILAPAKPASLKASLYGHDDVNIKWNKSKSASGYYVYYKKASEKKYTYIKSTTATSLKKANLADGCAYTFKVVPYITIDGKKYASPDGSAVKITTLKKITGVKIKTVSKTHNKISWKNIDGETGYQIARSASKTKNYKVVKTVSAKYSYAKLKKTSKKYYYKVRAYKTVDGKRIYAPWSDPKRK